MKHRNLYCHWVFSLLLTTVFLFVSIATRANSVTTVRLGNSSDADNIELKNNTLYVVDKNITITAKDTKNALKVGKGNSAVIDIRKGCTLTVKGGNAVGSTPGGAGIYVPTSSTLVITGEGTLNVTGGFAGDGGNGGNGGDAYISSSNGYGGCGGYGGYGGGGAGAAIGGYGGYGHDQTTNTEHSKQLDCDYDDFDNSVGIKGSDTQDGGNGMAMGTVYILSSVTVNATGGSASYVSGSCGEYGNNASYRYKFWILVDHYFASGSGAPGGGGGAGYGVKYAIGGGARGAQCGGQGSSGGTWSSGSYKYHIGNWGWGGHGNVDGAHHSDTGSYHVSSTGGQQTAVTCSDGDHGTLFTENGGTAYGRSTSSAKTNGYPDVLKVKFTLNPTIGNTDLNNIIVYYRENTGVVLSSLPTAENQFFQGYYTTASGDGTQIINSKGEVVNYSAFTPGEYFLYARWSSAFAVNETTGVGYITSIQDAIDNANSGEVVRMCTDASDALTISKALTLNMNGYTVQNDILVKNITDGDVHIVDGNITGTLQGIDGNTEVYTGNIELDNMTVNKIISDGHSFTINSGIYPQIENYTAVSGDASRLQTITIKGDETYVDKVNTLSGSTGPVRLLGGVFTSDIQSTDKNITCPGNYGMTQMTEAPEGAPDGTYLYSVDMRTDINNYVRMQQQYISSGVKATANTKLTCHVKLNSMPKGLITVIGSSDASQYANAHKGFGVYIDGNTGAFIYAAGTEFQSSPEGLATVDKDYYITLSNGYFRVDTVANASSDFYHETVAMYQFRENSNYIGLGTIGGAALNTENTDMNIYDFAITESGNAVCHLVPAYGFQHGATESDLCLFDLTNNVIYYDADGKVFTSGLIGLCEEHPAYRITGEGMAAKRMCSICGQTSAADRFVQSAKTFATLSVSGTTDNLFLVRHYADISDNCTEYQDSVRYNSLTAELKNQKVFEYKWYRAGSLLAHYTPVSYCGKFYLYDDVNDTYTLINDDNATSNFDKNSEHLMVDSLLSDGMTHAVCKICGKESYINLDGQILFATGHKPTTKTVVKMRFKANPLMQSGQWHTPVGTIVVGSEGNMTNARFGVETAKNNITDKGFQLYGYGCKASGDGTTTSNTSTLSYNQIYNLTLKAGSGSKVSMSGNDIVMQIEQGKAIDQQLFFGASRLSGMIGQFDICSASIFEGDTEVARYVPSKYNNKPCLYDEITNTVLEPTVGIDTTYSSHAKLTDLYSVEDCSTTSTHKHLSNDYTVDSGTRYRNCLICNAQVKDARSSIHNSTSSYIDTEYTPTINTEVRTDFRFNTMTNSWNALFGSYSASNNASSFFVQFNQSREYDGGWMTVAAATISSGKFYNLRFTKNNIDFYADSHASTSVLSFTPTQYTSATFKSPGNMYLGALKSAGNQDQHNGDVEIYNFYIYENGKLARNFIPAQNDATIGYFETEQQKFYPMQGTGATANIVECTTHQYCDITCSTDKYGNETWTRRCRVCNHKEQISGIDAYIITNGHDSFAGTEIPDTVTTINVEYCTYDNKGNLTHRYLPSLWGDSVQVYDAINDKFYPCDKKNAQAYVPTCSFHRYYDLEIDPEDSEKVYRHCKLCNALVALNGMTVSSDSLLRKCIYKENNDSTMYIDMMTTDGQTATTLCQTYPTITSKNVIFGIAVMNDGKLMDYYLPARREKTDKNGKKYMDYGMYNTVKDDFYHVDSAKVFFTSCDHEYSALSYIDGNIMKKCYLCDSLLKDPVGYYIDLAYISNTGVEEQDTVSQYITFMNDTTQNLTDRSLNGSLFTNGMYYFSKWNIDGADRLPGEQMTPSATYKGKKTAYAVWNDGFTVNGDTLEVNDANTENINIVDNGMDIFGSTKNFDYKNITYTRELPEGSRTWGTLCLPFDLTSNDDIQFFKVTQIGSVNNKSVVIIDSIDKVKAGEPCIYHHNSQSAVLTLKAQNGTICNIPGSVEAGSAQLVGFYDYCTIDLQSTAANDSAFAISGDRFLRTGRQITVRPYHAYISIPGTFSASARDVMFLMSKVDWLTSSIPQITGSSDNDANYEYYDLSGRKVNNINGGGIFIRKSSTTGKAIKIKE